MSRGLIVCTALFLSMKLEKSVVQRRLDLMEAEGVVRHFFLRGHRVNVDTVFFFHFDRRSCPTRTLVLTSMSRI